MTITPILWTSTKTSHGRYPIKIRVTEMIDGKPKTKYYPVGAKVTKDDWDHQKEIVKKEEPLAPEINLKINEMVYNLKKKNLKGEAVLPGDRQSYYWWFEQFLKNNENIIGEGRNAFVAQVFKNLKRYRQTLSLEQLDLQFLNEYRAYLLEFGSRNRLGGGISINTVRVYFQTIRAVYRLALGSGAIEYHKNPFNGLLLRSKKVRQPRLNYAQVLQFYNADLPKPQQRIVRDWWIISYFCDGMRFADLIKFNEKYIKNGKLQYTMSKTKKIKTVDEIESIALELLEKYNFEFPWKCNPKNEYKSINLIKGRVCYHLPKACKNAGIPAVTLHKTRHSIIDRSVEMDLTPSELQGVLGHSTLNTTVIYLQSDYPDKAASGHKKLFPKIINVNTQAG